MASAEETFALAGQDVARAERALSLALEGPREGLGRRLRRRRKFEDLAGPGMAAVRNRDQRSCRRPCPRTDSWRDSHGYA